jgi:hypothetical protein
MLESARHYGRDAYEDQTMRFKNVRLFDARSHMLVRLAIKYGIRWRNLTRRSKH